jgi:hypothetical protein
LIWVARGVSGVVWIGGRSRAIEFEFPFQFLLVGENSNMYARS